MIKVLDTNNWGHGDWGLGTGDWGLGTGDWEDEGDEGDEGDEEGIINDK
ncbi:hypothetical protein [Calothrix sp. PCC 7507]|nr:hypothetical protein [Calothrix sp. PCC 7507]